MTVRDGTSSPALLSVNVGMPADREWSGGTVRTAIWKLPVDGPVAIKRLNLIGDDQADKVGHGGEHRAVFVYQIESYEYWQRYLGRDDFEFGQFGENFTVSGLSDQVVCVGDRYHIGSAVFEVTQPRVTCYRVGIRLGVPTMPALLVEHHRPGFYLRVLEEGHVRAGDPIIRLSRPPSTFTVADIDALLYLPDRDTEHLRRAVGIDALSDGWRQSFRELLDAAADPTTTDDTWTGFTPFRVVDVRTETPDVRSIIVEPVSAMPLPSTAAGQYLTIRVPKTDGPGFSVRNYSLSSGPTAAHYRISVKHEPRGEVSTWLHTSLATGHTVEIAQPRGDFTLRPGSAPIVLASAGIGVTPVLAMLHALAAEPTPRPVTWIHVAKSPETRPFTGEVAELLARLPVSSAHVFYTATPPGDAGVEPADAQTHYGRPTVASLRGASIHVDSEAYVCGPASFMRDMTSLLSALGVDTAQVFTEAFGPSGTPTGGVLPHPPPGEPGCGPGVTFSRSGLTVPFPSGTGISLLDLAEACDVPARWSCRTGVCHSCITPVISGTVDYLPQPLDRPGDRQVLLCCATPETDVVLDA